VAGGLLVLSVMNRTLPIEGPQAREPARRGG
jgi:hypothetical protein